MWSSPSFFFSSGWWRVVSTGRLALDDGNNIVIDWNSYYYDIWQQSLSSLKNKRRPFISMGRKALNSGAVEPSLMNVLSWLPPIVPLTDAQKGTFNIKY